MIGEVPEAECFYWSDYGGNAVIGWGRIWKIFQDKGQGNLDVTYRKFWSQWIDKSWVDMSSPAATHNSGLSSVQPGGGDGGRSPPQPAVSPWGVVNPHSQYYLSNYHNNNIKVSLYFQLRIFKSLLT